MPRGPIEISEQFYARARLAVANCSLFIWGAGQPAAGRWLTFTSRVLEKTAEFTASIMWETMKHVNLADTKTLHFWSGTGPAFRNYKMLATQGVKLVEKLKCGVTVTYGTECHMKGACDGFFSHLNKSTAERSLSTLMCDIPDLIECWTDAAALKERLEPNRACEKYINFEPPEKSSIELADFKQSTLPVGIVSCHEWQFCLIDPRRKSVMGRGELANTATNIWIRPNKVPGRLAPIAEYFHPVLLPAAAVQVVPEDVNEEPSSENTLGVATKTFRGWRTSHRLSEPEQKTVADYKNRLARKRKHLGEFLTDEAQMSRGPEAKQIAAAERDRKDRVHKKNKTAYMTRLRKA